MKIWKIYRNRKSVRHLKINLDVSAKSRKKYGEERLTLRIQTAEDELDMLMNYMNSGKMNHFDGFQILIASAIERVNMRLRRE